MKLKKKKKKKKKNFFFFLIFFFWGGKKSLESAPKFLGRSGNRKHSYFFFWPKLNSKCHITVITIVPIRIPLHTSQADKLLCR